MVDWSKLTKKISDGWNLYDDSSVQKLIDDGVLSQAIVLANKKIKKWPKMADAWKDKADALFASDRTREAILAYEKALKLSASDNRQSILRGLMWAHHDADEYKKAIEYADRLLKANRLVREYDPVEALSMKADCLEHLGKFKEQLKICQEILKNDPDNVDLLGQCANALLDLKRYKESESVIDKLIELDPEDANLMNVKANLYRKTKKFKKVIECSNKILKMIAGDDDLSEAWYHKSLAEFELEDYKNAKKSIQMSLKLDPSDGESWIVKAGINAKLKKINPKKPLPQDILNDLEVGRVLIEADIFPERKITELKDFIEKIQPGLTKLLKKKTKMI